VSPAAANNRASRRRSGSLYLRNQKLSGIGPGEYFIGSMVDVTDAIPERAETNNTLATPGRITLLAVAARP
jgi:hypothetical protein